MVPAGIGVVRGRRDPDRPAYVLPGRCTAPVATHEPTGVLELLRDRRLTLGDLFAVWAAA